MSYQQVNSNVLLGDSDPVEDEFIVNDDEDYERQQPPTQQYGGFGNTVIPEPPESQQVGSERLEQRRFMGGDTLDEPVYVTLLRDVKGVGTRLRQVVWRREDDEFNITGPQQWDLWGPLIFCLMISTALSMLAPNKQSSIVFSGMFALIWLGQVIVTLNIKLLGGSISFFHALCVTGYSLFPLVVSAVLSGFIKHRLIRLPIDTVLVIWAIYSSSNGLKHSGVIASRVFLASFPVGLFFAGLGWICVIT
ncbi:protein Yip4p [Trichomonascus vanleenenianus]|uniref:Yip4p n=1 Tax=Trichomonascus vanleenenianus TaxID=2268995 RepID=UPI003ECB6747